jgi:hypothetical protein
MMSVSLDSPYLIAFSVLYDKVCQLLAAGRWFSSGKTDSHDITEILLKVALNTITPNQTKRFNYVV